MYFKLNFERVNDGQVKSYIDTVKRMGKNQHCRKPYADSYIQYFESRTEAEIALNKLMVA